MMDSLYTLIKIVIIAAILLLMSLWFIPVRAKLSFSYYNSRKSDRYKNFVFVGAAAVYMIVVVVLLPILYHLFSFDPTNTSLAQWLISKLPFTNLQPTALQLYAVNVISVCILNILICIGFIVIKRIIFAAKKFNRNEDDTSYNQSSAYVAEGVAHEATQKVDSDDSDGYNTVLVEDYNSIVESRRKRNIKRQPAPKKKAIKYVQTDDNGSFFKRCYESVLSFFYTKESDFHVVAERVIRCREELRCALIIFGVAYFLMFALLLISVFFPVTSNGDKLYNFCSWVISRIYSYPSLSLILLFEFLFFMDGHDGKISPRVKSELAETKTKGTRVDLYELKKTYEKAYKVSKEGDDSKFHFTVHNVRAPRKQRYIIDKNKRAINSFAQHIIDAGVGVDAMYLNAIENLYNGKNLLCNSSLYSSVSEYIIRYVNEQLACGERAIIICKSRKDIQQYRHFMITSFATVMKTHNWQNNNALSDGINCLWNVNDLDGYLTGKNTDVLLLTAEEFLNEKIFVGSDNFFEELSTVLVTDAEVIVPGNNYFCLIIANKIAEYSHHNVVYLFFSNGKVSNLDNSIAEFFNIDLQQLYEVTGSSEDFTMFIWDSGSNYIQMNQNHTHPLALETSITQTANRCGIPHVSLFTENPIFSDQIANSVQISLNSTLFGETINYVVAFDAKSSLPALIYNYSRYFGEKTSIVHLVSRPYLLREFFSSNAENFVASFSSLSEAVTEVGDKCKCDVLNLIFEMTTGIPVDSFIEKIRNIVKKYGCSFVVPERIDTISIVQCIDFCLKTVGITDIDPNTICKFQTHLNDDLKTVTTLKIMHVSELYTALYKLSRMIVLCIGNAVSSEDEARCRERLINTGYPKYLIDRIFLPGQTCVFGNSCYKIESVDVENGIVNVDELESITNIPFNYLPIKTYEINKLNLPDAESEKHIETYNMQNATVLSMQVEDLVTDIVATVKTAYEISGALQTINFVSDITPIVPVTPALVSSTDRAMLISISCADEQNSTDGVTMLFAVLLQEFIKTIYPNTQTCISACPILENPSVIYSHENELCRKIAGMYPSLYNSTTGKALPYVKGKIQVVLVEDTNTTTGVFSVLRSSNDQFLNLRNLFANIYDYLSWHQKNSDTDTFIYFGADTAPDIFDFEKLTKVMSFFELKHDSGISEGVENIIGHKCAFCKEICTPENVEKLPDERYICTNCSEGILEDDSKLQSILDRIIKFINERYQTAEIEAASVVCLSTEEMANRLQLKSMNGAERFSVLEQGTRTIYIEHGLPIGTVFLELTEQTVLLWQLENLRFDPLSEDLIAHRLLTVLEVLNRFAFYDLAGSTEAYYLKDSAASDAFKKLNDLLHEMDTDDSFAYMRDNFEATSGGKPVVKQVVIERDPSKVVRYRREQLSESDKKIYDAIDSSISAMQPQLDGIPDASGADYIYKLFRYVLYDHPEYFWLNDSSTISFARLGGSEEFSIKFTYTLTSEEVEKRRKLIDKALPDFCKGISDTMCDYDVALKLYENLIDILSYNSEGLKRQKKRMRKNCEADDLRSVYGGFVCRSVVCVGYAKTYQYLLQKYGIEVTPAINETHEWNIIKLEGDYYNVDVTWGDTNLSALKKNSEHYEAMSQAINHKYFCCTTEDIMRTREWKDSNDFPPCTARNCNYYVRSGYYMESFDLEQIEKCLIQELSEKGRIYASFMFASDKLYDFAKKQIVQEKSLLTKVFKDKTIQRKYKKYFTICDDKFRTIDIFFLKKKDK